MQMNISKNRFNFIPERSIIKATYIFIKAINDKKWRKEKDLL